MESQYRALHYIVHRAVINITSSVFAVTTGFDDFIAVCAVAHSNKIEDFFEI